ncbi:MAG TPA: hypothetical protein VKE30_11185 [Chthoniobacterales bacterium]|nr:hypothetical protein [Chthoniobacterales bacterium]
MLLGSIEHGPVLVAFIQRVIRPFYKDLGPFDKRGGEKTGEGANEDFLEECRVHPFLQATMMPVNELFGEDVGLAEARLSLTPRCCAVGAQAPDPELFKRFPSLVGPNTGLKSAVSSARELRIFWGMAEPAETETKEIDPDQLTRLLELELIQKRATWKQAGERARSIRTAGFVFLFVLIVACLLGGYVAFMRVNQQRTNQQPSSAIDH